MSFEQVPTIVAPLRMKTLGASISYLRWGRVLARRPRLTIGLPARLAAKLDLSLVERYVLQFGVGEDVGKVRVVRSSNGEGIRPVPRKGGSLIFCFGHVPWLGSDAAEREYVEIRPIDHGIEFDAPSWLLER